MRRLLTTFLLVVLPAAAQSEPSARLSDLEVQRGLHREYRRCVSRKDVAGAVRALVKASQLVFVVPPPFSAPKDAASHLRLMARNLRFDLESVRWKGLQASRSGATPEAALEALDQKVRELYGGDDLGNVFTALLKRTAGQQASGSPVSYNWGRRLRAVLPHFPCVPGRLDPKLRKVVKEEWKAASMTARRDFLRNALLEARAFALAASFLDVPEKPGLTVGASQAKHVEAELLQLSPEDHAGGWVTTTLTLAKPPKAASPYPFLFESTLSVEELDPRLLVVYFYDRGAQASLVDAGRMKIAPHLVRWARGYPARALEKRLSKQEIGARIAILGRMLAHSEASPSHVLEIWKAELEK